MQVLKLISAKVWNLQWTIIAPRVIRNKLSAIILNNGS